MTDQMSPAQAAQHWQQQIEAAERDVREWGDNGDKIQKRYRAEKDASAKARRVKRFSILYSNTETLKAALYARTPKPDVRRRFGDRNPVARTAAEILERVLSYCSDNTGHDRAYRAGVHDLTLPGRGVVRLLYEARMAQVPQVDPMTGQPAMGPDGQPVMAEQVADQKVLEQHVYWRDVLMEPARCWREVTWVGFRHRMTREDLEANGFEDVTEVPLNYVADASDRQAHEVPDSLKRAEVWEIWCKRSKARYWIVKGYVKALRIDPDPYELEDFWPLAEPISAVLGTDSYIPTPYFTQYEDQADDLDEITARISMLVKALKRRGIYDSSVQELKRLSRAGDNEFIPVDGSKYNLIAQQGGLKRAFDTEDIKPVADTLIGLYDQRDRLVQAIYEVSGISDIVRGSTNPNETATAQNIKAQFGSMRLKDSQREVQRWVRDSYRIKAELVCTHFTPEKVAEITGHNVQDELFQAAMQVLRSDERRGYQIDIETDSTVFEDAEAEKQGRVELLTAMGGFAQQWLPVVQVAPEMMKMVGEMMAFGVRGFKAGNSMEDVIDETMQAIQQRMSQPQEPPPPDPAIEATKAKTALEIEAKTKMFELDYKGKMLELEHSREKMALEREAKQMDIAAKTQMHEVEAGHKQRLQFMDADARRMDAEEKQRQISTSKEAEAAKTQDAEAAKQAMSDLMQQIAAVAQGSADAMEKAAERMAAMQEAIAAVSKPKRIKIVRDGDGRAVGAETMIAG